MRGSLSIREFRIVNSLLKQILLILLLRTSVVEKGMHLGQEGLNFLKLNLFELHCVAGNTEWLKRQDPCPWGDGISGGGEGKINKIFGVSANDKCHEEERKEGNDRVLTEKKEGL